MRYNMFTARHVMIVGALVIVGGVMISRRCCCSAGIDANTADALREIRSSLHLYAMRHNGSLPQSLNTLAEDIVQEGGGTITFLGKWEEFLYVGNLTTNDPPLMPVVICAATGKGKRGAALLLNGSVLLYKDLDQEIVKQIVSEPWELVRQHFKDSRSFDAFRKRVILRDIGSDGMVQEDSVREKQAENDLKLDSDGKVYEDER